MQPYSTLLVMVLVSATIQHANGADFDNFESSDSSRYDPVSFMQASSNLVTAESLEFEFNEPQTTRHGVFGATSQSAIATRNFLTARQGYIVGKDDADNPSQALLVDRQDLSNIQMSTQGACEMTAWKNPAEPMRQYVKTIKDLLCKFYMDISCLASTDQSPVGTSSFKDITFPLDSLLSSRLMDADPDSSSSESVESRSVDSEVNGLDILSARRIFGASQTFINLLGQLNEFDSRQCASSMNDISSRAFNSPDTSMTLLVLTCSVQLSLIYERFFDGLHTKFSDGTPTASTMRDSVVIHLAKYFTKAVSDLLSEHLRLQSRNTHIYSVPPKATSTTCTSDNAAVQALAKDVQGRINKITVRFM